METLIVNVFAVLNGKLQPFGKSVYNGRANAVKTLKLFGNVPECISVLRVLRVCTTLFTR